MSYTEKGPLIYNLGGKSSATEFTEVIIKIINRD